MEEKLIEKIEELLSRESVNFSCDYDEINNVYTLHLDDLSIPMNESLYVKLMFRLCSDAEGKVECYSVRLEELSLLGK